MIWIVLHWIFLYICKPHTVFHGITAALAAFFQVVIRKKKIKWKKSLQNSIGIFLMYIGYYITKELWHFSFLPFWVTSIIGLRGKLVPLIIFAVVTGTVLQFLVLKDVIGHVIMNTGRMLRIQSPSLNDTILSHTFIFLVSIVTQDREYIITQREVLAVISTLHMIKKFERMDVFSLCMCYTHFFALLVPLLHLFLPYWYNYYENNHFYMVKRQYMYLLPIGILVQRVWYSIF